MTGPEHYRAAEQAGLNAADLIAQGEAMLSLAGLVLAEAQVHATLALAAATALREANHDDPSWRGVAS